MAFFERKIFRKSGFRLFFHHFQQQMAAVFGRTLPHRRPGSGELKFERFLSLVLHGDADKHLSSRMAFLRIRPGYSSEADADIASCLDSDACGEAL